MKVGAWAGLVFTFLVSCKLADTSKVLIVNGELSPYKPYMVGFILDGTVQCGGTLIRENVVLTAAHCKMKAGWEAVLGSTSSEATKKVRVKAFIPHPEYARNTQADDIAIAILEEYDSASFQNPVQPIELNQDASFPAVGDKATVSGWGDTKKTGEIVTDLRQAAIPVISVEDCVKTYPESGITDRHLCAGYPDGGIDSCQRDSGGPFVAEKNGKPYLVGVVSWGRGCAEKGHPGVYTRVSSYTQWIDDVLKSMESVSNNALPEKLTDITQAYCNLATLKVGKVADFSKIETLPAIPDTASTCEFELSVDNKVQNFVIKSYTEASGQKKLIASVNGSYYEAAASGIPAVYMEILTDSDKATTLKLLNETDFDHNDWVLRCSQPFVLVENDKTIELQVEDKNSPHSYFIAKFSGLENTFKSQTQRSFTVKNPEALEKEFACMVNYQMIVRR